MSNNPNPTGAPVPVSGNVVAIAVAAMFCFVVISITCMALAVEDGARLTSIVGIMLGTLTTTVGAVVTLMQVQHIRRQVDFIANGGTDAKVRAAVADVINPELIRPEIADQLVVDRAVRDRRHEAAIPPATPTNTTG